MASTLTISKLRSQITAERHHLMFPRPVITFTLFFPFPLGNMLFMHCLDIYIFKILSNIPTRDGYQEPLIFVGSSQECNGDSWGVNGLFSAVWKGIHLQIPTNTYKYLQTLTLWRIEALEYTGSSECFLPPPRGTWENGLSPTPYFHCNKWVRM